MKVLITGGAGFIGSTIASAAIDAGHEPVLLDNFVTGRREFTEGRIAYEGDIADHVLIHRVFDEHPDIAAVIHCAALIVVPDSVQDPIGYYEANVVKTLRLVEALLDVGCRRLIFSSSASIYEPDDGFSVDEASALAPLSPYARTKAVVEGMLADIAGATPLEVLSLRYFNPLGADPQLRTGLQVPHPSHALGKLIQLTDDGRPFVVTGTDYPTRDGTGIRDYVHVWDLARAHVSALTRFGDALAGEPYSVINLGTGTGTTVKELISAFEEVTGRSIEVTYAPRRPGDSVGAFTRSERARKRLRWETELGLTDGIADTLRWFEERRRRFPDLA